MPTIAFILRRLAGFAAIVCLLTASQAVAGGGPENVFLVVNARSWSSLTVANHFVRLRKLPITNVYYVDWTGDNERIDGETMRTQLLGPILQEVERRGIRDHIDYVVYSTDFPWRIDCEADVKGVPLSQYLAPNASLNGATCLYQNFMAKRPEFLLLDANHYFRPQPKFGSPQSHGFRSWYGWDKEGRLLEAGGEHYFLSTMLGVTSGRGNSTEEVVRYLTRSVGADFTRPSGTIYYAVNDDVRSKTREPLYRPAVDALRLLDVRGEIVQGVVPTGRPDVMGAMIGAESFAWRKTGSTIRAGAISEHLTSAGGVMFAGAAQTPLSVSLSAGAAASSGAVTEPYAIPQKFPSAFMHVHYARGCSLAEAFYQAVNGPYQLLIVGDPLCRPWAQPPRVGLTGLESGQSVKGRLKLEFTAQSPPDAYIWRFELYVDGILTDVGRDDQRSFDLDTRTLPDGFHELRVMAVCGEPIETRGGTLIWINVANAGRSLALDAITPLPARWGEPLKLRVATADALGIIIAQGSRTLAKLRGNQGEVTLDPRMLGAGPVVLQAAAVGNAGSASNVLSRPLEFEVTPNRLPPYSAPAGARFLPAMKFTQDQGDPVTVGTIAPENWLSDLGVTPGEGFSLSGFFSADADAEYQFQLRHAMPLELLVDDQLLYSGEHPSRMIDYVPIGLAAGLHKVEIRGKANEDLRLDVGFGLHGVQRLQPQSLHHLP